MHLYTKALFFVDILLATSVSGLDFLYNSFRETAAVANFSVIQDASFDQGVIRLTNGSNPLSIGRAFYRNRIPFRLSNSSNVTASFSTQFVFSVLPEISTSPGFGIAFVLSGDVSPPNALPGQYFGIFSNASAPPVAPLFAVKFDTGRNTEFNEPAEHHVGINLNSIISASNQPAGYYTNNLTFVPLDLRNGQNIHAWIDFNGRRNEINVTIAPAGMARPERVLLSYSNPNMANYIGTEMFMGFSSSITRWVELQQVLAWSFSDTGTARDINTTGLPVFSLRNPGSSSLSPGAAVAIAAGGVAVFAAAVCLMYWFWLKKRTLKTDEDDDIEDWELEHWPHRYTFNELSEATGRFSDASFLGAGGFGKVHRGKLKNGVEVAVKCVNHDSKQGFREFMAEISSLGRLRHKNLVQMRGWCKKEDAMILVYDYMPHGSLNKWIFGKPEKVMNWEGRRRVLIDIAEGLNYLHRGWDQAVVHRDIKSSNVLLDEGMRGRLGDFGLAKLYIHGGVPDTSRVVGTLGYLAPEVAKLAAPTTACDVYSFGVVVLEVVCGRRPMDAIDEDQESLVDWITQKYVFGRLFEAVDVRLKDEYEVDEIESIMKLGLACCHPDPIQRPAMNEVVSILMGKPVKKWRRCMLNKSMTEEKIDYKDEI